MKPKNNSHVLIKASCSLILDAADKEKEITVQLADGSEVQMKTGAIAIAAITSCTNTSNPYVLVGAGLVAKKAVEKGLQVPAYVKTSLAPGSKVVSGFRFTTIPRSIGLPNRWLRLYNMYR